MIWYAAAVLLLVAAVIFRLGLLAYALYVIIGVLVVSRYFTKVWTEGIFARREVNRLHAEVGDKIVVNIPLENRSGWLIPWVLVEDLLPREALIYDPPHLGVEGRRVQLAMLAAGQTKHLNYTLVCNRRGYYQIGPLVVETGDLFGLQRKYLVAEQPQFLLVLPKVVPLAGYQLASRRPLGEVRLASKLYEDPTRISGVREYQAGDPLNRVHWRATARTSLLHSKIYEPSSIAGATIVADFQRSAHDRRHEPRRSELAITAAASIAHALYLMGQQVGIVSNGRDAANRIRREGYASDYRSRDQLRKLAETQLPDDRLQPLVVPTRRGAEQITQILETLARLELSDGLSLAALLIETMSRLPRDATVIVILPQVTPTEVIALQMLKSQGFSVVAVVNVFDEYEYSVAAGPLLAAGIQTRHLKDELAVSEICSRQESVAFV